MVGKLRVHMIRKRGAIISYLCEKIRVRGEKQGPFAGFEPMYNQQRGPAKCRGHSQGTNRELKKETSRSHMKH